MEKVFKKEVANCLNIIDSVTALLASYAPYRIGTELERAQNLPYVIPDMGNRVRARYTWLSYNTLRAQYPSQIDYAARCMYELVKYYYKPRMETYFDTMAAMLAKGETSFPAEQMDRAYENITMKWIDGPLDMIWTSNTSGDTIELIKKYVEKGIF